MLGRECTQGIDFCKSEVLDCSDGVGLHRCLYFKGTDIVDVRFSLLVASIMAIGAIVIVNITIFRLNAGAKYHGSLTLVEIAGIISLIFSGSIISMAVIAFFLGLLSQKMRTSIKEYYQTITEKERNALNTYNHL